ncbi:hypothetical protein L3Q82_006835 [Scortum barcoo]|uniref:Uncharacterized protein n=1 Tax=Scortum barcoo TaxID=214431 RepID=A0ACB8WXC6_9TELE|nr:hypothetical protein L3Q82_006835 [Scortum barcoo]
MANSEQLAEASLHTPPRLRTLKPASVRERRPGARTEPPESRGRRRLQLSRPGRMDAPRRRSGTSGRHPHLETEPEILKHMAQLHVGTQMSSSISGSVRGQGDDEEKEGEEEDEGGRWGGAGAEQRQDRSERGLASPPVCCTLAGKRADIISLRKHLGHARRLASAIKRGQSYFHLLQKEAEEEQEEEERRRARREERLRTEPRPPSFSSDSDSDSEGWPLPAGTSWSGANEVRLRRKKSQSARPFTPVHHSLTSPLLSEASRTGNCKLSESLSEKRLLSLSSVASTAVVLTGER